MDEETKAAAKRFLIADRQIFSMSRVLYAKERRLVEMVQSEVKNRRAVRNLSYLHSEARRNAPARTQC